MKNIKKILLTAIVCLSIMNIYYINEDKDESLLSLATIHNIAFGESGNDPKQGPLSSTDVECTKVIVTSSTYQTNNYVEKNAGANAGFSYMGFNVGGNGSYSNNNSNGNSTTTTTTVTSKASYKRYYCEGRVGSCTPGNDPCLTH